MMLKLLDTHKHSNTISLQGCLRLCYWFWFASCILFTNVDDRTRKKTMFTCVTSGTETVYPSGATEVTPYFLWILHSQIFSFLCRIFSIIDCLFLLFRLLPLYCLFVIELRLLISPLVSSNVYLYFDLSDY